MKTITKAIITLSAAGITYVLVQKRKHAEEAQESVEISDSASAGIPFGSPESSGAPEAVKFKTAKG